METDNQLSGTQHQIKVSGKWLRLVLRYKRIPFLNQINPFFILVIVVGILLVKIFPRGECTCAEQIADQKLEAISRQGNKEVQNYMNSRQNIILCASKRQELLKRLEKEKKLNVQD